MSLFAVKNDKGEWLYSDEYNDWVDQLSQATFYDTFEDADDDIECWELSNAHVAELVEAPEKVVVSEEEAAILTRAKEENSYALSILHHYAGEHGGYLLGNKSFEDRLMCAYVIGYTVAKEKRYQIELHQNHSTFSLYWLHLL